MKVQLVTAVKEDELDIPPPEEAELPVKVQPVTVVVESGEVKLLAIPPPCPRAELPMNLGR